MALRLHELGSNKSVSETTMRKVFSAQFNEQLIHQVLVSYASGARYGTKSQKSRAEVRGGGRKPWRQKGLGRARAGTIRSPIWRGGGVTFAAKPRSYVKKVNKKMYCQAMCSMLSKLMLEGALFWIDDFKVVPAKTKVAKNLLQESGLEDVLIVTEEIDADVYLSVQNLPNVDMIEVTKLNPYCLLNFSKLLFTKNALAKLEKQKIWLA